MEKSGLMDSLEHTGVVNCRQEMSWDSKFIVGGARPRMEGQYSGNGYPLSDGNRSQRHQGSQD